MSEILGELCLSIFGLSILVFIVGLIMLFFERKRKLGVKLLIASGVFFLIGFGTCVALIKIG